MNLKTFFSKENYSLFFCFGIFFLAQAIYSYFGFGYGKSFFGAITQIGTDNAGDIFINNFWQSVYYYHLLPPGYIVYAFGFNKLFPPDGQIGIYFLHTFLSLWAITSLYRIQENLGINKNITLLLILIYVLSPSFNLYQTMGWYDFPSACLLIISTWRIFCFADKPTFKNGFEFFFVIALLCSIRPMYHIVLYFIPIIVVSLFVLRKHWNIVLLSASIPFLIIFAMYFKNYMLYGIFSVNSYSGENISMITSQWNFPLAARYEGIKKGYFSDMMLCQQTPVADSHDKAPNFGYTGYDCWNIIAQKYRDTYIKQLGKDYKNVPILQPIPGQAYLHRSALGNIGMDLEFGKNAVQALIHYPQIYLTNIRETWRLYFSDSVSYFYENMGNVRNLPTWLPYQPSANQIYALTLFLPFLMFFGVCLLLFAETFTMFMSLLYFSIAGSILFYYRKTLLDGGTQYMVIKWQMLLMGIMIVSVLFRRIYINAKIKKGDFSLGKLIKPMFNNAQHITILFLLCNIAYSSFIMTMLAGNEQQRYRFYVNGLFLILLSLFIQLLVSRLFSQYFKKSSL